MSVENGEVNLYPNQPTNLSVEHAHEKNGLGSSKVGSPNKVGGCRPAVVELIPN
jgi:hypothetical protein